MRLNDDVQEALAELAEADSIARASASLGRPTVEKAMAAAARLARSARALPDLPADRRDQLWRFLDNPYMRLAIDGGPFSIEPPDAEGGEATTQLITADGGRFDAAGFVRRLYQEWRDILGAA